MSLFFCSVLSWSPLWVGLISGGRGWLGRGAVATVCKLACCLDVAVSVAAAVGHIWDLPYLAERSLWWNCRRAENDPTGSEITHTFNPPAPPKKKQNKRTFVTRSVFSRGNYLASCGCILVLLEDWYHRPQPLLLPSLPVCCSLTSQMLCISSYFAFPLSNADPEGTAWQQKGKKEEKYK